MALIDKKKKIIREIIEESGRWFTRSLNRDNYHFLTHAGTAFAVMALSETNAAGK